MHWKCVVKKLAKFGKIGVFWPNLAYKSYKFPNNCPITAFVAAFGRAIWPYGPLGWWYTAVTRPVGWPYGPKHWCYTAMVAPRPVVHALHVGVYLYAYVRTLVFASQTPFKMRAPLALLRKAHSTRIRTGALDRRSSTGVSAGDDRRSSAPIAGTWLAYGQCLCTYVRKPGLPTYLPAYLG